MIIIVKLAKIGSIFAKWLSRKKTIGKLLDRNQNLLTDRMNFCYFFYKNQKNQSSK